MLDQSGSKNITSTVSLSDLSAGILSARDTKMMWEMEDEMFWGGG